MAAAEQSAKKRVLVICIPRSISATARYTHFSAARMARGLLRGQICFQSADEAIECKPPNGDQPVMQCAVKPRIRARAGFAVAAAMVLQTVGAAFAAQTVEIELPASGDLVPAPFGYEAISGNYATAHKTDVYISPYLWAGTVLGTELPANQPIQVLAKVKDYDWLLVGSKGVPLGYLPLSVVSPVK